jgi:hypothetical protein
MDKPKTSAARNTMSEWERQCYDWGWEDAEQAIIEMLESKLCECVVDKTMYPMSDKETFLKHMNCDWEAMMIEYHVELIKGEQPAIHTHEIEVFGAPCDCGTRHEYCGECDWVEPCEPEGEQK